MTRWYYLDIRPQTGDELSERTLLNRTFTECHRLFKTQPGTLALALPEARAGRTGSLFRLFAQQQAHLEQAQRQMATGFYWRDYCQTSPIREVPEPFKGPYKSYQRFRIPNQTAKRRNQSVHAKRLAEAQQLPYFVLHSQSNRQEFTLRFDVLSTEQPAEAFAPNGYGFGSTQNPLTLPDIPA